MGYRSINIKSQETTEALAAEFARKLGAELGWTVSGNSVVHESGIRFTFTANAQTVEYGIGNGTKYYGNGNTTSFNVSANWILDIITSESTTAIGVRNASSTVVRLNAIVAENMAGEFTAILPGTSSAALLKPTWDIVKSANLVTNNSEGLATSLMLYPDIYAGCMFKNLYMVYSCPLSGTDKIMHIGGIDFRYIGSTGNYGFALAV